MEVKGELEDKVGMESEGESRGYVRVTVTPLTWLKKLQQQPDLAWSLRYRRDYEKMIRR